MKRRNDGSIQSTNAPVWNKTGIRKDDYGLYRCMVTKVIYADNRLNVSKNAKNPEVLYEVVILGGNASGQLLSNVRFASTLKGERTLKATTKDISKVKLQDHDGDIVQVQFLQGDENYPQIVAFGKGITDNVAATSATGPRSSDEFNGVTESINNSGETTKVVKGGTTKNGVFTPDGDALITESFTKDEKVTRTYKSGLTVVEDGKNDKVTITTSGGATAEIDGKGNKVSIKVGSTEILIDGGSGKISLKGDMIDLGASVSDFVTKFTELASAFASHMHSNGNNGSPTGPPMAPLTTSVGSQTVQVQS